VAARAHRALARAGISPASLFTGPMSLTFLVPHTAYMQAQVALHAEFVGG
jgi:hypothetical protein